MYFFFLSIYFLHLHEMMAVNETYRGDHVMIYVNSNRYATHTKLRLVPYVNSIS